MRTVHEDLIKLKAALAATELLPNARRLAERLGVEVDLPEPSSLHVNPGLSNAMVYTTLTLLCQAVERLERRQAEGKGRVGPAVTAGAAAKSK